MAYNALTADEIRDITQREAQRQFLEYGLANTQMKNIAAAVGIGRSTLYRYFPQKEHLAFAVTCTLINDLFQQTLYPLPDKTLPGFEQLSVIVHRFIEVLPRHVSALNYFSEFDRMFDRGFPQTPEADQFVQAMNNTTALLARFIEAGVRDRSIRDDYRVDVMTLVVHNTVFGVAQRVLARSDHYLHEHKELVKQVLTASYEFMLASMKAP